MPLWDGLDHGSEVTTYTEDLVDDGGWSSLRSDSSHFPEPGCFTTEGLIVDEDNSLTVKARLDAVQAEIQGAAEVV